MANNTCCCCFPIRAGVLIIATVSSIFYIGLFVGLLIHRQTLITPEYGQNSAIAFWIILAVSILYSLSSLFGIIGGVTKNRAMTNVFKLLYWIMAILTLLMSFGLWIAMMVKRDDSVAICSDFLQHPGNYGEILTDTYSQADADSICSSSMRNVLIASGVAVFVGNFIQLYFACAISAYATRLRRTNQHEKLRNLEDFPVEPIGKAQY